MEDPNPVWECACGTKTRESSRHEHLGECRLFIRSWRAAFHALARSLYEQRRLSSAATDGATAGAEEKNAPSKTISKLPPTLDQRLTLLEKAVTYHSAKQVKLIFVDYLYVTCHLSFSLSLSLSLYTYGYAKV
jgi:hypothetical protein